MPDLEICLALLQQSTMAIEESSMQTVRCRAGAQVARGSSAAGGTEQDPKSEMAKPLPRRKCRAKLPKVKTGCITCRCVSFLLLCFFQCLSLTTNDQNSPSKMRRGETIV
jgi:hypothetical protein